jgi:mono/diheme cytochrome c family protein
MHTRHLLMGLLLVSGGVVSGCDDDSNMAADSGMADLSAAADMAVPDLTMPGGGPSAARGDELVNHLLFCGSCHTTPDGTGKPSTNPVDFLAGGKAFNVNAGGDAGTISIVAPNLTPDTTTGIGSWTTQQIKDAITKGTDDQGMPLWSTMPYARFANLTDDDATSIALYLQSITARVHATTEDPLRPAMAAAKVDFTSLPHTTLASGDSNFASAERGRYLGNLGCVSCHSPSGAQPLGVDLTKAWAGGKSIPDGPIMIQSANITPDATGIGGWTVNDVVQTLKTDMEKGTGEKLCAPMNGGPNGFGGLADADLTDIGQFLTTLAPIANGPFHCPDGGM